MQTCSAATKPAIPPPTGASALAVTVARRALAAMAAGETDDFARLVHPDAVDHDAGHAPPNCRGRGPAAFLAMGQWLRAAFDELDWEVHEAVTDGHAVVVRATMSARHVGPFVRFDASGRVERAFAPTYRHCAVGQTHWFGLADDLVIEHHTDADGLSMAAQLGWLRSSFGYRLRCAQADRRARRRTA